jgi:hypothetical protein
MSGRALRAGQRHTAGQCGALAAVLAAGRRVGSSSHSPCGDRATVRKGVDRVGPGVYPNPTLSPRPQEDGTAFGAAVKKELTSALKAKAEGSALALADAARDAEAFRRCARACPRPRAAQGVRADRPAQAAAAAPWARLFLCKARCCGRVGPCAACASPCTPALSPDLQQGRPGGQEFAVGGCRARKVGRAGADGRPRTPGGWSMSHRCGSDRPRVRRRPRLRRPSPQPHAPGRAPERGGAAAAARRLRSNAPGRQAAGPCARARG